MSDKMRGAAKAALKWLQSTEARSMEEYLQVVVGLRAALAEPEQEPVACVGTNGDLMWLKKPEVIYSKPRPLYTAPPRREWVGLTDEEIDEIGKAVIGFNSLSGWENEFGLAIETKLREKNT